MGAHKVLAIDPAIPPIKKSLKKVEFEPDF